MKIEMKEPLEKMVGTLNGEQQTLRYGRKHFLIKISLMLPYPKEFQYREEASAMGTAINRAVAKMRKELKGRKIKEINVKAIRL